MSQEKKKRKKVMGYTYKPPANENINKTAECMVVLANVKKKVVIARFNGIKLRADKYSSIKGVVADYHAKREAAEKAFRNSPEGREADQELYELEQTYK